MEEIKKEERERKNQLDKIEERLIKKEESIDSQALEVREKEKLVNADLQKLVEAKGHIEQLKQNISKEIERVSGLSVEEARSLLIKDVQQKYQQDLLEYVQKMMRERKEEIEKQALGILTTAMQRYSRSSATELTTSSVQLPDGEVVINGRKARAPRSYDRLVS